jgi:PadR family transcriptional regulator PadR
MIKWVTRNTPASSEEQSMASQFAPHSHRQLQLPDNFSNMEVMRKREYLGQLELMVLLAVVRPTNEAYGVQISRDIAEKSGREVALASVYAALERLERKGFVRSSLGQPSAERGGKARTYFKATAAGVKEAREAHGTLMRLSVGLASFKGETA